MTASEITNPSDKHPESIPGTVYVPSRITGKLIFWFTLINIVLATSYALVMSLNLMHELKVRVATITVEKPRVTGARNKADEDGLSEGYRRVVDNQK